MLDSFLEKACDLVPSVGVDIVFIPRIQRLYLKYGLLFAKRILTPKEYSILETLEGDHKKISFLAGRFAAKEAVLKALGTGLSNGLSWQFIEVLPDSLGAPKLFLYQTAQKRFESAHYTSSSVSISHDHDYALAAVIFA